jgi:glycerol kinase
MNVGETAVQSPSGLLPTLAWVRNGKCSFALDGGIYIGGAATKWLQNGLKIIDDPRQADELALSIKDNGGVYFVPAFTGLGAPHWDSYARGAIFGLTGGATNAHIARATLESIAYQVKDVFDEMRKVHPITTMRVDGGSTKSDFLMQFQADILGVPVEVPVISETTALGTAYLASLGFGELSSLEETATLWKRKKVFEPNMGEDERAHLLQKWRKAVERAKGWEEV